ncbi:MAG: hypothetical protein MUC84_10660, partial [Solirubrobacteraceae bacterium]|nr:hypothetical protein [Solirubrobacteraceae bacterium]
MDLGTVHNPLLEAFEARLDEIAARTARAVLEEVPAHGAVPGPAFAGEVREHSRRHAELFLATVRSGRPPAGPALAFVRERGARRARELLPLDAVLHSYLVGQRTFWEALVEEAGDDLGAALELTGATFAYSP